MMLAHRMDSAALQQVRAVFQDMDQDQSGRIHLHELKSALVNADTGVSDEDAEFLFNALDQDSSGRIQYSEFLAAAATQREISEADAKDLFHRLDLDGSGVISVDNLSHFVGDKELLAEAVEMVSSSAAKAIDLDTFVALMLGREIKPSNEQILHAKSSGSLAA